MRVEKGEPYDTNEDGGSEIHTYRKGEKNAICNADAAKEVYLNQKTRRVERVGGRVSKREGESESSTHRIIILKLISSSPPPPSKPSASNSPVPVPLPP